MCPYKGSVWTDDVNDKWKELSLLDKGGQVAGDAEHGSHRYVDCISEASVGMVVHINRDRYLSAQSVKDLTDLQYSLCPAGSPELLAIPPPTTENRTKVRWMIGLKWADE